MSDWVGVLYDTRGSPPGDGGSIMIPVSLLFSFLWLLDMHVGELHLGAEHLEWKKIADTTYIRPEKPNNSQKKNPHA